MNCCPSARWIPPTCATKIAATDKYSELPVRLKLYPVGMTKATICRGTPMASIASMARGSAASELDGREGDRHRFGWQPSQSAVSGTRNSSAIGSSTPNTNTSNAAYSVSTSFSRLPRMPSPVWATV